MKEALQVLILFTALLVSSGCAALLTGYGRVSATVNLSLSPEWVLWLDFERVDENNLTYDNTKYGNNATVHGAVLVEGKVGKALKFDGADDYVEIPDDSSLEGFKNGLTITAWVKPNYSEGDGVTGYILNNNRYHLIADTQGFKISVKNASGTWSGPAGETTSYTAGNWYFIAGRYDPATHTVQMFVNGVAYDTESLTGDVYSTADPHRIGMSLDSAAPFKGIIDELKIFNVALSEDEIRAEYLRGR